MNAATPGMSSTRGRRVFALTRRTESLDTTARTGPLGRKAALKHSSHALKSITQSAEDFINIKDLRLRLYETIQTSAPGNFNAYSGFLTASSVIYREATSEILKLRTSLLAGEEQRWARELQCAVRIPPPATLFQLREATVLLPASLFSDQYCTTHPQNGWTIFGKIHYTREGALADPFVQLPLGQLDVDRLSFSIYEDIDHTLICQRLLLDFLRQIRNTISRMHQVYWPKYVNVSAWNGGSSLLPSDCPLKAQTTTISWNNIRTTHRREDYGSIFARYHLPDHDSVYWSSSGMRNEQKELVGWEYSRRDKWAYDHRSHEEQRLADKQRR